MNISMERDMREILHNFSTGLMLYSILIRSSYKCIEREKCHEFQFSNIFETVIAECYKNIH